jgi:hypothetical protein
MNDVIQCGELQVEAKQLLRYRVPLVLAILVNGVLIARIPVAAMFGPNPASNTVMTGKVGSDPGQSDDAAGADRRTDVNAPASELEANDPQRNKSTSPAVVPETVSPPAGELDVQNDDDLPDDSSSDSAAAVPEMPAAQWRRVDPVADETVATGEYGLDASDLLRTTHAFTRDAGQVVERFLAGLDEWRSRAGDLPAPETADEDSRRPDPTNLILRNRPGNHAPVRFLVQGRPRELWPGEVLELPPAGPWTVEFHRGGDLEDTQRVLDPGAYQFEVTRSGWDLRAIDP